MVNPPAIAVLIQSSQPQRASEAEALAEQLSLPLVRDRDDSDAELFLTVTDDRLELRDRSRSGGGRGTGVFVDFSKLDPRTLRGQGSRNQPLIKAFGRDVKTIVDATAGLGQDAALLACMKFRVTAVERSPIIAALLEDGLRRALNDARLHDRLAKNLTIVTGDARDVLASMSPAPDAVFIDPMFPPKRKKSALPPKSIRLVRAVVGEDEDAADLLREAMSHARHRVVVKRPTHAPPLGESPTVSYESKVVRYDAYRT